MALTANWMPRASILFVALTCLGLCVAAQDVDAVKSRQRILCVVIAERGHFNPMLHMCMHLAKRGWNVKIASQRANQAVIAEEYPKHAQLIEFIPAGEQFFPGNETERLERRKRWVSNDMLYQWMELARIAREMYAPLNEWFSQTSEPPTLIIGDVFTFAGPMLAESRGIPLIVNSPVLLGGITNPLRFISIQGMNVGKDLLGKSGAWGLMSDDLEVRSIETMDGDLTAALNSFRSELNLPRIDSSVDSYRNAVVLVDSAIGFEYALPLPPRVFHVGPLVPLEMLHRKGVSGDLQPDLARWLTQHDEIVYFSMGSVALLSEGALKSIFRTLVDKHVIFALPKNQHALARSFVSEESQWRLDTWAPQKQILAHPNVKLFISHCGMGGTQEGLLAHVPLLCIPQFGDQFVTTYRVVHHGVGEAYLERPGKNIQFEEFKQVFEAIWNNLQRYQTAASNMGRVLAAPGGVDAAERIVLSIASLESTNHLVQPLFSSVNRQSSTSRAVLWSIGTLIVVALAFMRLAMTGSARSTEKKTE